MCLLWNCLRKTPKCPTNDKADIRGNGLAGKSATCLTLKTSRFVLSAMGWHLAPL